MPQYKTTHHVQILNSLWKEKKQEQCKPYFNSLPQDQQRRVLNNVKLVSDIPTLHRTLVSIHTDSNDKEIIYDLAAEYILEQAEEENDYNVLYDIVKDLLNYLEETETIE